jgi:hypothetical protein
MSENRVIIVHLRRPRTANPKESRSDPFWEFGSFGITTCHGRNLMNPKNACKLEGVHLAFAHGGKQGTRLVHLTPPVKIDLHPGCVEAKWSPAEMPFRYCSAPILAINSAKSQFPKLAASLRAVRGKTCEGRFASKYRSTATCLDDELAIELIKIYAEKRRQAPDSEIACSYVDALPCLPPLPDVERDQTYAKYLDEARGSKRRDVGCRRKSC